MDKKELVIDIFHELDFIRFIAKLCDFAIDNDAKFEPHQYAIIFWYLEKHSYRVSEMVEKLHPILPVSED